MAITAWDDYLIHQSAKTVDQMESDDMDAMERLYVGCHNDDGTLHFASGLGTYPNRNVMDAYVCVRRDAVQHNLRVSRHLADDRADMRVGPVSFEVIEPQRRWAVQVEENDSGISGRVEFTGRGGTWMTAPPSHYDQLGRFEGSIVLHGETIDVNGFVGARDRSWGVRQANLFGSPGWGGHFWIHVHFSTFCLTLVYAGIWDGNPRCGAAIIGDDGNVTPMNEMQHRIDFAEGVRALNALEILFRDDQGAEHRLVGTRISPAIYFNGGGYDRPGEDRGPLDIAFDEWDVSTQPDENSPRFGLHQQIAAFEMDGESGVGILEASFSPDPARSYRPTLDD